MTASVVQSSAPPALEVLFGPGKKALSRLVDARLETWYGVNQIPSAKLLLRGELTRDAKLIDEQAKDAKLCQPGTQALIRIKSGATLFSGIVVEQRLELQIGQWEMTLRLKHHLQRLVASHQNQVYENKSDEQIVRSLLIAKDIKPGKLDGMQVKHMQMVQFGCSDWQFLKARLSANGVWLKPKPESNEVDVIKPAMGGNSHTLKVSAPEEKEMLLETAELEFGIQSLPCAVEVSSWDIKTQKMSNVSKGRACKLGENGLDPSKLKPLSKTPWSFTRSLPLPAGEQLALAEARLLAQQAGCVRARFTLMGNTKYKLGDTLKLEGLGSYFKGAGVITEVNHKMASGQWRTTIALGLDPALNVESAVVPEAVGLHIGVVDTYKEDPNGLNRLRVRVPALLGNKPLWARFAAPYASDGSGLCFYPEVNDEVVLGFFDADPRYPVILGAMHNPKNKAPFAPSKDNHEKAMVFVQGETKQKLTFNVKEASILLDNNGKESVTLKKGIQIEGDEQLSIHAKKVTFKADQAMQLQAMQDLKLDSKKGVAVDAPKVDVNAKAQLTLQGTAGVKIKGAMVDLSN